MPDWCIERLGKKHERSSFDCGYPALNKWLREQAGQSTKKDLARTYVATQAGELAVVGFYASSNHAVAFHRLFAQQAKGLPKIDIPVVLLGRLAADLSAKGQGLGKLLLIDCFRRVQSLAEQVGIRALEVTAIDDSARDFYFRFGFEALADDPPFRTWQSLSADRHDPQTQPASAPRKQLARAANKRVRSNRVTSAPWV
jgi:predicted GNAT family N-acyltransferase